MTRLVATLLLLPLPALAQPVVTADDPHAYGWWLGDALVQRVGIALPPGVTVDPASLPKPRAVDYWLDLRAVATEETAAGLLVTLHWQNFYSALEPGWRQVPAQPIRLSDGTAAELPGFGFVTSPIRPLAAPSSRDQLLPDPPFRLIDTGPARVGLALSLAALILSSALLAWHQGWGPFRTRRALPFTRAARAMARHPDRRLLHRALDAAFGRVLIGADLPQFLSARPEYRPLSDRLAAFFAASDAAFFGKAAPPDPAEATTLARALSRIERGRR